MGIAECRTGRERVPRGPQFSEEKASRLYLIFMVETRTKMVLFFPVVLENQSGETPL
jgi:hypothetical protein